MRGLDPRIHHLRKKRFPKMMDCRVISAFTRVFRRAMPGNDSSMIGVASATCRGVARKAQSSGY